MRAKKRRAAVALVGALVAGCDAALPPAEPRLDASSDDAFQESMARVRGSLSESDKNAFDEALQALMFGNLSFSDFMTDPDGTAARFEQDVKRSLDGKTAADVILAAESVIAERKAREREQGLEEIAELRAAREASSAARKSLKDFKVVRSRYYKDERSYGRMEPVIELTVRNDTKHPVARAYFEGTIASPERSVPWLVEDFNYSIPGGLEPGEEDTWNLAPNSFSEWGRVDAPADAVFTVVVKRIDGADGEALFSADQFSERDAERLKELEREYGAGPAAR